MVAMAFELRLPGSKSVFSHQVLENFLELEPSPISVSFRLLNLRAFPFGAVSAEPQLIKQKQFQWAETRPSVKGSNLPTSPAQPGLQADSSPHSGHPQRPSVPCTIVSLGAWDTGASFPSSFQRDFLIWGFLPGTPLLDCFCVSWSLNLNTSVCP